MWITNFSNAPVVLQQVSLLWIQTKTFHFARFQPLPIEQKTFCNMRKSTQIYQTLDVMFTLADRSRRIVLLSHV